MKCCFLLNCVAVAVTVVVPTGNTDPLAWEYAIVEEQLSVDVAAYVTAAPQTPGSVFTAKSAGQAITGASLSVTTMSNEHEELFPAGSVAVAVTVVVPTGNTDPLA